METTSSSESNFSPNNVSSSDELKSDLSINNDNYRGNSLRKQMEELQHVLSERATEMVERTYSNMKKSMGLVDLSDPQPLHVKQIIKETRFI